MGKKGGFFQKNNVCGQELVKISQKFRKMGKNVLIRLKTTCFSTFSVGQDQNSWSKFSDPPYLHRPRAIPVGITWKYIKFNPLSWG